MSDLRASYCLEHSTAADLELKKKKLTRRQSSAPEMAARQKKGQGSPTELKPLWDLGGALCQELRSRSWPPPDNDTSFSSICNLDFIDMFIRIVTQQIYLIWNW